MFAVQYTTMKNTTAFTEAIKLLTNKDLMVFTNNLRGTYNGLPAGNTLRDEIASMLVLLDEELLLNRL